MTTMVSHLEDAAVISVKANVIASLSMADLTMPGKMSV